MRQFGFFRSKYGDTGATYGETHALIEFARLGELEGGELARILNIDKSQASKLIKGMEQKGWIQVRTTQDGRKKIFRLSEQGRAIYQKVDKMAESKVLNALSCLSDNEQKMVSQALGLFAGALEKSAALAAYTIRPCKNEDNAEIASIVRRSLKDLGFAGPGTAAQDPSLDYLSSFNRDKQCYLVAERDGKIYGGAGIARLQGESQNVCELVRMFLHPEARSSGLSQMLIEECLKFAQNAGYKICYLETTAKMIAAQRLYAKNGFQYVKIRRGDTGHFACNVLMEKKL